MEELASLLLQSRTQAHSFHLGVKGIGSHSAHLALGEYYDAISGLIDGLVETYQGKEGLIQLSGIGTLDKNNDIKNIIKYLMVLFYGFHLFNELIYPSVMWSLMFLPVTIDFK